MAASATTRATRRRKSETPETRGRRAAKILDRLRKEFPKPSTALHHDNAFQLLIATILSAQCTDERVNMVTKDLFTKYPTPNHFAVANQAELEQDIRSTGFFRMKTKSIIGCSKALMEKYGGRVAKEIDDLVQLPGVGRKTANVVLGQAYGIISGVVVDTHVHRLARRLGLTTVDDPEKIEQDLMQVFQKKDWIAVGSVLILHGRRTCHARNPKCLECSVKDLCPSAELFVKRTK
jgi:endonuclease-3